MRVKVLTLVAVTCILSLVLHLGQLAAYLYDKSRGIERNCTVEVKP